MQFTIITQCPHLLKLTPKQTYTYLGYHFAQAFHLIVLHQVNEMLNHTHLLNVLSC